MKAKLKCWFETFDFTLPKSQTKRIKPKYFASVIKLKDLKSMIFEHQNHIRKEFRVLKSFKSKKQKTTYEKKEKKNVILIVENETNKKKEFTPWSLQKQPQLLRASTSSSLDHLGNQN